MTLLAIDPGRAVKPSIGWALFMDTGEELLRGEMTWDQLVLALQPWTENTISFHDHQGGWTRVHEVVCEDFVNDPKSARGGQRNGTSEVIGAIEFFCAQNEVPFTRQRSDKLGPAKLHAPVGSWKPLKHLRHEDAAFLHGYEYLVRQGVLQSAGLSATLKPTESPIS